MPKVSRETASETVTTEEFDVRVGAVMQNLRAAVGHAMSVARRQR
jgi:hypothetical protein